MSFSSGEWTIPELCVWIQMRTADAVNALRPQAQRSLKVADLICPGAYARRDEVIEKAQEGTLVVTCQNPQQGWGQPERITLSAGFWKSAELRDVSSWMAGGGPGVCAARPLHQAKIEYLDLLVGSAKARELWKQSESTSIGGRHAPVLTKGEIPDLAHVEKMIAARGRYKSWEAVIAAEIDLSQVQGQSDEAKRKRLVKKATAHWNRQGSA